MTWNYVKKNVFPITAVDTSQENNCLPLEKKTTL